MKTINKPGDNLGGLTKIWAIPNDVISESGMNLSISDDSNLYEIYCTPESMEFEEPKEQSDAGIHYNTQISGFIPGTSAEKQEAIEYIEYRKWVIVFRDGNGNYKVAGSRFTPLQMENNFGTGKDTVGKSGYSFSFTGKTLERARFINNPF